MKKYMVIACMWLLGLHASGQSPVLKWAKAIGGASDERGHGVVVDDNGNVIVTGSFRDTVDFDPGAGVSTLISNGSNRDIFIAKYDGNGNFLWAHGMGATGEDEGRTVTVDAAGNVYVVGKFKQTVDFDPGAGTFNLTAASTFGDFFVLKLDAGGNFTWAKAVGGLSGNVTWGVTVDFSGNVIFTGAFGSSGDFDPGPGVTTLTSAGNFDILVVKLNSTGNFMWAYQAGGPEADIGYLTDVDSLGNIYLTGLFTGIVDFDPGPAVAEPDTFGDSDIFILKLDPAGNLDWVKSVGGSGPDDGRGVVVSPSGDVYATGKFRNTVDFDPGPGTTNLTSASSANGYILHLDANGNFGWVRHLWSSGGVVSFGIARNAAGELATTGYFSDTIDFDPGGAGYKLVFGGGSDVYYSRHDPAGNVRWAGKIGGSINDWAGNIDIDSQGDLYPAGYFNQTADFAPGPGLDTIVSAGFGDAFFARYSQCDSTFGTDVVTACDSFTWIDGNTYTSNNNTATFTLMNAGGCDSLVTLDLTINTVDTSVTFLVPTLTASAVGAAYQWLDCGAGLAPISGATGQSFTPLANGSYAVEVTQNGCTDTSGCHAVIVIANDRGLGGFALRAFPNPGSGRFMVDLGVSVPEVQWAVYNVAGQRMLSGVVQATAGFPVEIAGPAGVYLMEVRTPAGDRRSLLLVKE